MILKERKYASQQEETQEQKKIIEKLREKYRAALAENEEIRAEAQN